MEELIMQASSQYGVPAAILYGIMMAESSGNKWALRYEPNFRWLYNPEEYAIRQTEETERIMQKTSFGLFQIMGATARELGYDEHFLSGLLDPETNIKYACLYLKRQYRRYENWEDAIAAYNAGSARKTNGRYVNQQYVDRVNKFKEEW